MSALGSSIISILLTVLIISLLVTVHELGHFLAARLMKVRVEKFSLGFGPVIWKRKRGDTEYSIRWILLGGYVQMYGDQDATSFKQDVKTKSDPQSYLSKKSWQKIVILSAGVFMNLALAVIFFAVFLASVGNMVVLPRIGNYQFTGATVYPNAIYLGSEFNNSIDNTGYVLTIAGTIPQNKQHLIELLKTYENRSVTVTLAKASTVEVREIVLNGDGIATNLDLDFIGSADSASRLIIAQVNPDGILSEYKVLEGKYIWAIAGEQVFGGEGLNKILTENLGKQVDITTIDSQGVQGTISVHLPQTKGEKGILGVLVQSTSNGFSNKYQILSYPNSIAGGFSHTINTVGFNAYALSSFVKQAIQGQPQQLVNNVGSIVAVGGEINNLVQQASVYGTEMLSSLLHMAGAISAVLALMNILPVPLFDGGQIMFVLIEALRGRPLSERLQENIYRVFFVLIVALGIIVILKDIVNLF